MNLSQSSPLKSILSQGHRKSPGKTVAFSPIIQYRIIEPRKMNLIVKVKKLTAQDLKNFSKSDNSLGNLTLKTPKRVRRPRKINKELPVTKKQMTQPEGIPSPIFESPSKIINEAEKSSVVAVSPIFGSPKRKRDISPVYETAKSIRAMSPVFGSPPKSSKPIQKDNISEKQTKNRLKSDKKPSKKQKSKKLQENVSTNVSAITEQPPVSDFSEKSSKIILFEENNIKYIGDGKITLKLEIQENPLLFILSLNSGYDANDYLPELNLTVHQVINIYRFMDKLREVLSRSDELAGNTTIVETKEDHFDIIDTRVMYGKDVEPEENDQLNILQYVDSFTFEPVQNLFECLWFSRAPWDKLGYLKMYPNGLKKSRRSKFLLVFFVMAGRVTFTINKSDTVARKGTNIRIYNEDKYSIRNHSSASCILKIIKFN